MEIEEKIIDSAHISYNLTKRILTIHFAKGKAIELDQAKHISEVSSAIVKDEIHANLIDSTELLFISNDDSGDPIISSYRTNLGSFHHSKSGGSGYSRQRREERIRRSCSSKSFNKTPKNFKYSNMGWWMANSF